jgi:type VI secretion system secreted protein Hcp
MLKVKLAALTVASATALALAPSAHAATDYFMRLDPVNADQQIKGESVDSTFKDYIQIKSFSWGVENVTTIGSATGGAGAGKAKFDQLKVEKVVDSTTPQLLQRIGQGQHFAGVEIIARKSGVGAAAAANPMRYYFSLAFPVSDEQRGDEGDDVPSETLTFAYGGVAQKVFRQAPGGTTGSPLFGSWNQVTNSIALDNLPIEMK